jgi:voltage-gated potassium channel Kch
VIWLIFLAELVFILMVAQRKGAAPRAHWLDAAIVVVTVPAYGRLLSSLRLVRLVRLLRLLRAGVVISRALQAERRLTSASAFRFVVLATIFLTVIAGAVQAEIDTRDFHSFWNGVWWAVVTVTTVGYGDLYPKTVAGRLVAMTLMFVGIGFLAVLTATIASQFVKGDRSDETADVLNALNRLERDIAEVKVQRSPRSLAESEPDLIVRCWPSPSLNGALQTLRPWNPQPGTCTALPWPAPRLEHVTLESARWSLPILAAEQRDERWPTFAARWHAGFISETPRIGAAWGNLPSDPRAV